MADPALITSTILLERLHDSEDSEAWQLFDQRFRGVLIATGLRLGLARNDAEDTAQETMLQAVREYRQGRYDRAKGRLSSWILGIARHRIIDVLRRSARRQPHGGSQEASIALAEVRAADLEDAFDHALERHIFDEAWRMLKSEAQQDSPSIEVFELTSIRGVPIASAAEMTGLTTDQVYVARSRVAKKLRTIVERVDRAVRDGI